MAYKWSTFGAARCWERAVILLLDTSTPVCRLTIVDGETRHEYEWDAQRELAHGLLEYLVATLASHDATCAQLEGIGVFRGPGSFTGLRISMATLNTIADSERIPIVGTTGESWREDALKRLDAGDDDRIVLPEYGRDARITTPRK